ncbi:hypothetical protein IV203_002936 [Nitzschia inconspicua]|uniref:Uncharacterized protein n=1 Tax=Nitzschia inconspicua TaxID=303405 RepID=A0A9K3L2P7_9STRA|nr:hypothetical protein IV203_002936 [Nitzschia inconspicua]
MWSKASRYFLLFVTAHSAVFAAFRNGDTCGVSSQDFLNYNFQSDFLVAGEEGCTLGDDTHCYCAPDLSDGESLGEWKWQCNNSVQFGPSRPEKICPESVPVTKGMGDLDVVFNRRGLQFQPEQVSCDTSIHPTGRPGDEVCAYSSCDEGGDHSAICACVDLEQYGHGEGMEWVCMHATCSCGENDGGVGEAISASQETSSSPGESVASLFFTIMLVGSFVAIL